MVLYADCQQWSPVGHTYRYASIHDCSDYYLFRLLNWYPNSIAEWKQWITNRMHNTSAEPGTRLERHQSRHCDSVWSTECSNAFCLKESEKVGGEPEGKERGRGRRQGCREGTSKADDQRRRVWQQSIHSVQAWCRSLHSHQDSRSLSSSGVNVLKTKLVGRCSLRLQYRSMKSHTKPWSARGTECHALGGWTRYIYVQASLVCRNSSEIWHAISCIPYVTPPRCIQASECIDSQASQHHT